MHVQRVGFVGLGYIADFHAAAVRRTSPRATLIGLDLHRGTADRAQRSGLVDTLVDDLDGLLDAAPDVVHVLTPPGAHAATAVAVLEQGVDVLVEKPLASSPRAAGEIAEAARRAEAAVGVSHNMLFVPVWQRARDALDAGVIGLLRSVEVATRRPVPALRVEDTTVWMLQGTDHVLFEVAPHAFAHVLDVLPGVDIDAVVTADVQHLPNGVAFVRSWEVIGHSGDIGVQMSLAFDDAWAESTVRLRGTLGLIEVDLDHSTITVTARGAASYDLELAAHSLGTGWGLARGAARRLVDVVGSKASLGGREEPFAAGITASVGAFHGRMSRDAVDRRHSLDLAMSVVDLADAVAQRSGVDRDPPVRMSQRRAVRPRTAGRAAAEVVVLGGTGFIGRHVVRSLAASRSVRVVARRPEAAAVLFDDLDVEIVPGDVTDTEAICSRVSAGSTVVDLAFSGASTWDALYGGDAAATCRLADALSVQGVRRYIYASTIAIYGAGRRGEIITERTPPGRGTVRVSPYPRMKAVVEQHLEQLHRTAGLPVVVARPGVVLGVDSDPCHWGVAAWPYSNVCVHWGRGDQLLPLVLVEDVADALVAMVDVGGIEGESFNLCADSDITAQDYVAALIDATGEPICAMPRSTARWFSAAAVTWALKRPGSHRVPFPSWDELSGRGFAARFDCAKAAAVLGWAPERRRSELIRRGVAEPAKAWQR